MTVAAMLPAQDVIHIQQLVCREREARDRRWWDEMRQVYSPNAQIRLSWYQGTAEGFIDGSIRMANNANALSAHRLQPIVVRIKGSKAVATLSVTIDSRLILDSVEADLESHARLIYRAAKASDNCEWKLVSLDCIYQRDTLRAAITGEHLVVDLELMKSYRSTYRCLSYALEKRGYPVNGDLPGDDRPEQVNQLYDDAFTWLRQGEEVTNHLSKEEDQPVTPSRRSKRKIEHSH